MHRSFRDKFASYLTNGLPVKIENEELPDFYKALDKFVNKSDSDFSSFYIPSDNKIAICDKYIDYLTVSYEDEMLVFRTTDQTSNLRQMDEMTRKKLGEAFLGVVLFVESLSPSEDLHLISRSYSDKWIR